MTVTRASEVSYDPYDVDIYTDPYAVYRRLRDETPLYYNPVHDFYALSRFDDVERALVERETFISSRGVILEMIKANLTFPSGSVILEDPPVHTAHRGLLARVFTPRRMLALEPQIREFCVRTLDQLVGADRFDFVADVAAQLPMRVIGMLLGIPVEDQATVRDRAEKSVRTEPGKAKKYIEDEFLAGEFFADYIDWRYQHPSDDVMTELIQAEFEDETGAARRLTRNEVLTYVNVLASAGNETTTRLIGWMGKVLADHPDQRRELVEDPSLIPNAIEETLRYEPIAHHIGRCTARDVELHGQTVPAGSAMLMLVGAANHDDRRFPDGDRFDIHRKIGHHLTFGYGIHFCLGTSLARLEGRVALEEVLKRFPTWDVDTDNAKLAPSSINRGWDTLPVLVPARGGNRSSQGVPMSVTVTPIKPEIGVEITGVHGHAFVDAAVATQCEDLLERHGVVVYRDAHIDDDDLVAFSRLLGEVEVRPSNPDSALPEIFIVSLDPELSTSAPVQKGTFNWHIDGTTSEFPHKTTLLACREVSNDGSGDTEFANTYAAYAALSDAEKAELAGLLVEYGYANASHREIPGLSDKAREVFENTPQKVRPVVWARQSGRKSMLLGSTAGDIVGRSSEESRVLLEQMLAWATQSRFVIRHRWRLGDLVVWDNTGMLHRALPYTESSRRLMHRTTLVGSESVA